MLETDNMFNTQNQFINIFIDNKCNFNCDICAYEYYKTFEKLSFDDYENILNQLDAVLSKYEDRKIIISYIGGEPTFDLELLELFVYKTKFLKDKYDERFLISIVTNGYFGRNEESIKCIKKLNFDIIQLSCSESHYEQGNYEWFKNIIKRFDNLWIGYIGSFRDIIKLYPEIEYLDQRFCFSCAIRKKILKDDFIEGFDDKIVLGPHGIFITPKGIYTKCANDGNNNSCYLGDLNEIEKCLNKLMESPKLTVTMNGDLNNVYPICDYLKIHYAKNVSCFNNNTINIIIKEKGVIEINEN